MLTNKEANALIQKWEKVLDYTNTGNLSGDQNLKLPTALLLESQEQWIHKPDKEEIVEPSTKEGLIKRKKYKRIRE